MNPDPHAIRETRAERQKELQDWRATLTPDEDQTIASMIEVKGEDYVLSMLDFLKDQLEYVRSL